MFHISIMFFLQKKKVLRLFYDCVNSYYTLKKMLNYKSFFIIIFDRTKKNFNCLLQFVCIYSKERFRSLKLSCFYSLLNIYFTIESSTLYS